MPPDPRKSLEDIRHAAALIAKFVNGRTFDDYRIDESSAPKTDGEETEG